MTDEVDISNDRLQHDIDRQVEEVRRNAELPPGKPGDCEMCGECRSRGRAVNFGNPTDRVTGIPADWFGYWTPDAAAEQLNIDRINQRGGLRRVQN